MTTKNFCRHCSIVPAWEPDLVGFTYQPGRIKKTYLHKKREKTPQTLIPRATLVLNRGGGGLCIFPNLLQFLELQLDNYAMLPSGVHVVQYFSKCLNPGIDLWGVFIPHEIVPFLFSCSRICLWFCSYWKTLVTDILFSQGTRNQSFLYKFQQVNCNDIFSSAYGNKYRVLSQTECYILSAAWVCYKIFYIFKIIFCGWIYIEQVRQVSHLIIFIKITLPKVQEKE